MDVKDDAFFSGNQTDDGGGTPVQDEHVSGSDGAEEMERTEKQHHSVLINLIELKQHHSEDEGSEAEEAAAAAPNTETNGVASGSEKEDDKRGAADNESEAEEAAAPPAHNTSDSEPEALRPADSHQEEESPAKCRGGSTSDTEEGGGGAPKQTASSDSENEENRRPASGKRRKSIADDSDSDTEAAPPPPPRQKTQVESDREEETEKREEEQEKEEGQSSKWKAVMHSDSENEEQEEEARGVKAAGSDQEPEEEKNRTQRLLEDSEDEEDKPVKRKKAVLSDSEDEEVNADKPAVKRSRAVSDVSDFSDVSDVSAVSDSDHGLTTDSDSEAPDKSMAAKLRELGSDSEDEEDKQKDDGEKKDEETLFSSDSESGDEESGDEEQKMIADIFGESGDEEDKQKDDGEKKDEETLFGSDSESGDEESGEEEFTVNGRLTLGENIADMGGLKLSYYLKEQMSLETARSSEAARSHGELLQRVEEMEGVVEMERRQAQIVQLHCHTLRLDGEVARQRLQEEEVQRHRLQGQCLQLQEQAEAKDSLVCELRGELKSAQLALQKQQQENNKLVRDSGDLRTATDKVQVLNGQLESQCSELSAALQSLTVESAKLQTEHQASIKTERSLVFKQLQEQDLLLEAARRNIQTELQGALVDKVKLQRELETLKADHAQLSKSSTVAKETAVTQCELLECTVERLRGELNTVVTEEATTRKDRDSLKAEMCIVVTKLESERSALERQLTQAKLGAGTLSATLQKQGEENRSLMGRLAATEHQQHAQQQVEQTLKELTDSNNKLAYEKGTLQTRTDQLQEELQALKDAHAEGSRQHTLSSAQDKYTQMCIVVTKLESERSALERQLTHAKLGAGTFSATLQKQGEENKSLMDRLAAAEHQQHAQQQVEQILKGLTDSNKKLAYENGKLQTRTNKLQVELRALKDAHAEGSRQRKLSSAQDKYTQAQAAVQVKDGEGTLAKPARDKLYDPEGWSGVFNQGGGNVAQTLENVLASHSLLQQNTESLQEELGGRKQELVMLRRDRLQGQREIQRLQAEVEKLQHIMKTADSKKNRVQEPLFKALDVARLDNRKLAQSLDQAVLANSTLQGNLERTRDQYQNTISQRDVELREAKADVTCLIKRMETLELQIRKARDSGNRASQREMSELRKALEDSSAKSADLSRANRELREKVSELKRTVSILKASVKDQKIQLKQHMDSRVALNNSHKLKDTEAELKGLETLKEEDQKKNYE